VAEVNVSVVTAHGGHRVLVRAQDVELETPPLEDVVFYAGLGVLVSVGLVELPIALVLAAGHLLIGATNRPGLEALGVALEAV
jgi:hypothetical protein